MARILSGIRQTVQQMLNDEFIEGSTQDFKDDEIDLHIGECLAEISERRPYEVKDTSLTTSASRDLDISSIEDLLEVDKVEFPVDKDPREFRNVTQFGSILTLSIDTKPTVDQDIYLFCHKLHQLTESSSTISPQIETLLIKGTVAKVALAWINQARVQITAAISTVSDVHTAIGNMSAQVEQAIADLVSGRDFIGKKNDEAITAIDDMTAKMEQATADLAEGRALIGDKRTETETALGLVSGQITKAIDDLTSGRTMIDENRATADIAINNMIERIAQAETDLAAGRTLGFNKIYVGGNPLGDYANYASRELSSAVSYLNQARGYLAEDNTPAGQFGAYASRDLQTARAYIDEARGYMALDQITAEHASYALRQLNLATTSLQQARGYLEVDRPAIQFGVYASRELSNATGYLNQAGGYIREISSRLSITGAMNSYQTWANGKLVLYQRDLKRIARTKTYRTYPKD